MSNFVQAIRALGIEETQKHLPSTLRIGYLGGCQDRHIYDLELSCEDEGAYHVWEGDTYGEESFTCSTKLMSVLLECFERVEEYAKSVPGYCNYEEPEDKKKATDKLWNEVFAVPDDDDISEDEHYEWPRSADVNIWVKGNLNIGTCHED